jgi:hypothetical protein
LQKHLSEGISLPNSRQSSQTNIDWVVSLDVAGEGAVLGSDDGAGDGAREGPVRVLDFTVATVSETNWYWFVTTAPESAPD